jgi:hypothetical protein
VSFFYITGFPAIVQASLACTHPSLSVPSASVVAGYNYSGEWGGGVIYWVSRFIDWVSQ